LDTATDFGVPVRGRLTLGRAGEVIGRRAHPQTATSWNRLFEMLSGAFGAQRYHLAKDLRRIEQDKARVVAHFADDSTAAGDLLVGAAGCRSGGHSQLLPEARPQYAGYVAWRGLIDERAARAHLSAE